MKSAQKASQSLKAVKLEHWLLQKYKIDSELLPSNLSLCAGMEQLSGGERLTLG